MARADIVAVLAETPRHVSQDVVRLGREGLDLLGEHLPSNESVQALASAAGTWIDAKSLPCVLALTDRRLLFVAPSPQVVSWLLSDITKVASSTSSAGKVTKFYVNDKSGGAYQLGIDGEWGPVFAEKCKKAVAQALLRG